MERALRLTAFGLVAVLLQSTLVALSPWRDPLPDLVIASLVFLVASDVDVSLGTAVALVVGYFFDLMSGVPAGIHALAFPLLFLGGQSIQRRFFLAGALFEVTLGLAGVWFVAALVVAIRVIWQERPLADWGGMALDTTIRAAGTAVLAPLVVWLGNRWSASRRSPLATRATVRPVPPR